MTDIETHYYYTVEILCSMLDDTFTWDVYRGEDVGYDWWNYSPMLFNTEAEAIKAISESDDYKNSDWRIVKTTTIRTVTHEFKNS